MLLAALLAGPAAAQAGRNPAPLQDRSAPGKADQAEGARILGEFHRAGIAGDYWLEFELRVMPRKGEEFTVPGTMLGTRGPDGPLSRITLGGYRWLIASGPNPAAWKAAAGGVHEAVVGESFAGTQVTVFDLQMPFLYWTDFLYEGKAVVRGRPAHSFILRPPAGATPPVPGLTGVRVLLDVEFQAMVQAEELGAADTVLKTISLLELKKVGEQWLVKAIDVRDARTRDKTRFTVKSAALDLAWPAGTFDPANLAAPTPALPPGKAVRF